MQYFRNAETQAAKTNETPNANVAEQVARQMYLQGQDSTYDGNEENREGVSAPYTVKNMSDSTEFKHSKKYAYMGGEKVKATHVGSDKGHSLSILDEQTAARSSEANRSPEQYDAVIDQFSVEENSRYFKDGNGTYCNIFVSDVTKAMGAEIPHWVDKDGNAVEVRQGEDGALKAYRADEKGKAVEIDIKECKEQLAYDMSNWLEENEKGNGGWKKVSAKEAQDAANDGKPAVAIQPVPGGSGRDHTAVVRPETDEYKFSEEEGPVIAQAGGTNFNYAHVNQGFKNDYKSDAIQYWIYAPEKEPVVVPKVPISGI